MARGVALAAAIAVSLLAVSGAGGAPAQTPKRGGTVVVGTTTALEPACLNAFADGCGQTAALDLSHVLAGAFEVTPGATFRRQSSSRGATHHSEGALHAHLPHPPGGAVERRRPGQRAGLRLHPPSAQAISGPGVPDAQRRVRSVRTIDAKTVRVVLRERYADWRYLFPIVLPKHALARRGPRDGLAATRIDNPKTGTPIGSGPFLVGPGSAASS